VTQRAAIGLRWTVVGRMISHMLAHVVLEVILFCILSGGYPDG
jgi:hypothetical protein